MPLACASRDSMPTATSAIARLERVCFSDERVTGQGANLKCYLVLPGQQQPSTPTDVFSRPGETVWSRIADTDPVRHHEGKPLPLAIVHGRDGDRETGSARLEFGVDGLLSSVNLVGPFSLSWRWAPGGTQLAQVDLAWPDRQISVTTRSTEATRVRLSLEGGRIWEATVALDVTATDTTDARRATEAYISDGTFELPPPRSTPPVAVFPLCPLGNREVWEDWNGLFPRRVSCHKSTQDEALPWLTLERDDRGRIVHLVERTGPATRALRFAWHDDRQVPSRVSVELDGRRQGLEVRLAVNALPERTRYTRGEALEGLEVDWGRMRAADAFLHADGKKSPLKLGTRWSSDTRKSTTPELRFGLDDPQSTP
jgi:hypothetical protein